VLYRVTCKTCRLSSIWTDDPKSFIATVCLRYRHCEARIEEEVLRAKLGPRRIERRSGRAEPKRGAPVAAY
jgi:hypothetical protein